MKYILLFLTIILLAFECFSQDTIHLKDGRLLKCKISKIDSTTIYFDIIRNDNLIKTNISKSEVISFSNNTILKSTSVINTIPEIPVSLTDSIQIEKINKVYYITQKGKILQINEINKLMKSNSNSAKYFKKSNRNANWGLYFTLFGSGLIGSSIGNILGTSFGGKKPDWITSEILLGIGFTSIGISIPFRFKCIKFAKKAVSEFNSQLKPTSYFYSQLNTEFRISFQPNSVILRLYF